MFVVERWNDRGDGDDESERRDGERTPQFAAPNRAQLAPAPAGSAARGVGLRIDQLLDTKLYLGYIIADLANSANLVERLMKTKRIASTDAQNNFGRVLDDVVQNNTRYIVQRRNIPQVIIISVGDLERILSGDERERKRLKKIIQESRPTYSIGDAVIDEGE